MKYRTRLRGITFLAHFISASRQPPAFCRTSLYFPFIYVAAMVHMRMAFAFKKCGVWHIGGLVYYSLV